MLVPLYGRVIAAVAGGLLVLTVWTSAIGALIVSRSVGSRLDQLTLAEFIVSGGYDRHVRRARLAYRRRRDRLVAALRGAAPRVRVTGIAAGLHVLCELPPGPDAAAAAEQDVVARAAARGLAVAPQAPNRVTGQHVRPALIVGYGTPPEHAFSGAVARLCAVLRGAA